MAKVGGQWRGLMSGLVMTCAIAGAGMFALGWLDKGLGNVGSDLVSGLRTFLEVPDRPVTAAPNRPELYYSDGTNPLPFGRDVTARAPATGNRHLANHAERGALVGRPSVLDGNTIKISGRTISLWGIDAPELTQPCNRDGALWRCGVDASRALADFVGPEQIACYDKGKDDRGQMLGQCFHGTIDVNGWLVRNGWAFAERHVTREYRSRESHARMKHIGIWRSPGLEAPWNWRQSRGS